MDTACGLELGVEVVGRGVLQVLEGRVDDEVARGVVAQVSRRRLGLRMLGLRMLGLRMLGWMLFGMLGH